MNGDVALYVPHRGENKMVGRLYGPEQVFVHEESGTQELYINDAPMGLDEVVKDELRARRVRRVVCVNKRTGRKLESTVDDIVSGGDHQHMDGRSRFFLPQAHWRRANEYPSRWVKAVLVLRPRRVVRPLPPRVVHPGQERLF